MGTKDKPYHSKMGSIGLRNLGNTCFMNSALQCLSHCPILTEFFLGDFHQSLNRTNPFGMRGKLAESYAHVIKQLWSSNPDCSPSVVSPVDLKHMISKYSPRFSGYQQQDAHELLACLLDGLHEDLNRARNGNKDMKRIETSRDYDDENSADLRNAFESLKKYQMNNNSIITDLFQGLFKSTIECPDPGCQAISTTFDPYMYISLPIVSKNMTLLECIDEFCRKEELGPNNLWYCQQCKTHQQACKKLDIWTLPSKYLIFHLKRFNFSRSHRNKITSFVDFPMTFDIPFLDSQSSAESRTFELVGVCNHYGDLGSGHYTAYAKDAVSKKWMEFDDSRVSPIAAESVPTAHAYVLFYAAI